MSEKVEQGVAVRGARVAKRMTQAHLASAAGVSEKTVRRAENGDRIGHESLRALCAVLDLDATSLGTEAECVPDAADEARRQLAQRKVKAAFVVTVLVLSLALTIAWTVFEPADFLQFCRLLAIWTSASALTSVIVAGVLSGSVAEFRADVRESAGGTLDRFKRPLRLARQAVGGPSGVLATVRIASLPPAVLVTLVGFKASFAEPSSFELGLGAYVCLMVVLWIARATITDASGIRAATVDEVGA